MKEVINSGPPFPEKAGEKARLFARCERIATARHRQRVAALPALPVFSSPYYKLS